MITVAVINEELALSAFWDRIVVEEDEFRSGMECSACGGIGHRGLECPECHGNGAFRGKVNDINDWSCSTCTVGEGPLKKTLKFAPCPVCNGKGTSTIIIPDDAQTKPTTGVVKSIGGLCGYIKLEGSYIKLPEDACIKVGDRVVYHSHTGNYYELGKDNKTKIRVLKESEVLCRIHSAQEKSKSFEEGSYPEIKEVGV